MEYNTEEQLTIASNETTRRNSGYIIVQQRISIWY